MIRMIAATVLVTASSMGCNAQRRALAGNASATTAAAVVVDSVIVPASGVGELVVHGRGFLPGRPGRNTVMFGGATFNKVPASDDGRTIRFTIPDVLPTGSESAPAALMPGMYRMSVSTGSESSNVTQVTIRR